MEKIDPHKNKEKKSTNEEIKEIEESKEKED